MSIPRPIMKALIALRSALQHEGMSAPVAMEFHEPTYDKLLDGMADAYGMSRATLDQQLAHGCGGVRICGVEIRKAN